MTDPANRTIRYRWCESGDLRQITDAKGQVKRCGCDLAGALFHRLRERRAP